MIVVRPLAVSAANSRSAAYDIVLLAHVLSVVVGLGAVAVAGGYALSLRRSGAGSEAVRRYYRPGVNWAGRVLFLVPVFGFVLIGLSHHEWSLADGWISAGLLLWAVVAVVAELVLWPAERQLQQAVAALSDDPDRRATGGPDGGRTEHPPVGPVPSVSSVRSLPSAATGLTDQVGALCLRVAATGLGVGILLVATSVIMVAKP